jgi:hypothetical protein
VPDSGFVNFSCNSPAGKKFSTSFINEVHFFYFQRSAPVCTLIRTSVESMNKDQKPDLTRKSFLKKAGLGAAALFGLPVLTSEASGKTYRLSREAAGPKRYSANDHINFAAIGAGGMGQGNISTALRVSGTKLVAACDLYDSRLSRCRENWGDDLFTTRNYRTILNRSDVDAVIISTTDHWHEQIAIAALEAGKAVYLEKPMTQQIDEAHRVIETQKRTDMPLIIGSQRSSSILYEKARDLIHAGEIGNLNLLKGTGTGVLLLVPGNIPFRQALHPEMWIGQPTEKVCREWNLIPCTFSDGEITMTMVLVWREIFLCTSFPVCI